jgi:hypothetical protein
MTAQPEDTPNAQEIDVIPGMEVDTFFGCWLDINQPDQKCLPATLTAGNLNGPYSGSLLSINEVIANAPHQCLLAEIRDDDTPIPPGATTSNSDKLAQRNIAWIDGPNPGVFESRRNPHPFEIRATPTGTLAPDELMVFWGNTPPGSFASFYLPALAAADILALADAAYPFHQLTRVDAHTLQCPTGGVTFIPIPIGTARNAGLLTVDLPAGVKRGERYDITVRQTTMRTATITPPPPIQRSAAAGAPAPASPVTYRWREILGAFQVTIVISTKGQLLYPEERLLSWLRWKLQVVPAQSRWYPVLQRYTELIRGRVAGFGGDPSAVPPSPTGDIPQPIPAPGPGPHDKERRHFTGKVVGIIHDRFGDFTGFLLVTEAGHERRFKSYEPAVRELVQRAWADRTLITVFVDDDEPHWPESIVLRRLPD